MADKKHSSPEDYRREGAKACMAALRRMVENANDCGDAVEDYFTKRHEDAQVLAVALGPMSPFIEGAVIALAEVIHCTETTGEPNLSIWKPWAAMSESERTEEVARAEAFDITETAVVPDPV